MTPPYSSTIEQHDKLKFDFPFFYARDIDIMQNNKYN